MNRTFDALPTEFEGTTYRSRTEARWAVFFTHMGLMFEYEKNRIDLGEGENYLPDFYVQDFQAYFEVKPSDESIVTDECLKARKLSAQIRPKPVWLAMGGPSPKTANILPLSLWQPDVPIAEILATPENRYRLLEDRRDSRVYWLHSELTEGSFHHSYMVGGPGVSTDHDRLPMLHNTVKEAYETTQSFKF